MESCGESSYRARLLESTTGDPRFVWHAPLPEDRVVPFLASLDVCVILSIWLETGPLVLFEAANASTPVITSRLGGPAELVQDGDTGFLFSPGDAAALAAIIRGILEDPSRLAHFIGRLPKRSMVDVAAETEVAYLNLIAAGRTPATH